MGAGAMMEVTEDTVEARAVDGAMMEDMEDMMEVWEEAMEVRVVAGVEVTEDREVALGQPEDVEEVAVVAEERCEEAEEEEAAEEGE